MSAHAQIVGEDEALRQYLEGGAPGLPRGRSAISQVRRERSESASSYASDIVTVRWETGEEFRVFLKDFGSSRFPKNGAQQRRDRERGVYARLLAGTDLGTAAYYGSVWDEALETYWLLLEFVHGPEVRFCEVETWILAAGWLGKLQGHFARQPDLLATSDFLARHDAEFFHLRAELAQRDVARLSAPLASRLARVLGRYHRLVALLAGLPRTLVHGAYRPCNILAGVTSEPVRICPVDWEAAAFGSALYDLAYLTNGFEPPVLERFLDAYRHEAREHGVAIPDRKEIRHLVDGFRFSMTINLLSRACERGFSVRRVAKAVDLLEQLHRLIFGSRSGVQG